MTLNSSIIKGSNIKFTFNIFKEITFSRDKKKLDIFVIDDSKRDTDLLEALLSEESNLDFHLEIYHHPNEGISALSNNNINPDLIMVDLVMPEMNGNIVLINLQKIERIKHIPIIVYSSMNNYENIKNVSRFNQQVIGFFSKPLRVSGFTPLFNENMKKDRG